jgi:DNA invertase Pin-like site-specific DNA recombinase
MPRKRSHTIGYLRVSTSHQDTNKNQADILVLAHQHDLGKVRFIEEKASGKTPWRTRKIAEVLHMRFCRKVAFSSVWDSVSH